MPNMAMRRKLKAKEAKDIGRYWLRDGIYLLPADFQTEPVEYCDRGRDVWIWSIGQEQRGERRIFASTSPEFYERPGFDCLWLR